MALALLVIVAMAAYVVVQDGASRHLAAADPGRTLAVTPSTTAPASSTTAPAPTTTAPPAPATVPPPPTTLAPSTRPAASSPAVVSTPSAPPPPPARRAVPASALGDPAANIAPSPDFRSTCSGTAYDDSPGCVLAALAAIDNARHIGGVPPMALPANWSLLTPAQQLYVVTNLERTARGLAPLSAMASALDAAAAQGAQANGDTAPPPGFPWTTWGSNWAGQFGNPLEAMYYWMYDDGPGSYNVTCSASSPGGCWGHRHTVLLPLACTPCVMGAAWQTSQYGTTSTTEILVETEGSPAVDFTWAQEQPYLR
jgi:hypothetical protein